MVQLFANTLIHVLFVCLSTVTVYMNDNVCPISEQRNKLSSVLFYRSKITNVKLHEDAHTDMFDYVSPLHLIYLIKDY